MITTRTATIASALALTAATSVAVAPAYAEPSSPSTAATGVVHYDDTAGTSSGSLANPVVGAGLVLLAGVGVSIALAVSAGIAGGAFDDVQLPQIPGLPM